MNRIQTVTDWWSIDCMRVFGHITSPNNRLYGFSRCSSLVHIVFAWICVPIYVRWEQWRRILLLMKKAGQQVLIYSAHHYWIMLINITFMEPCCLAQLLIMNRLCQTRSYTVQNDDYPSTAHREKFSCQLQHKDLYNTVFYAGNWGILMNRLPTYRYPMLRKEYLAGRYEAHAPLASPLFWSNNMSWLFNIVG